MKLKVLQIFAVAYIALIFLLTKTFSIIPIVLFAVALGIDVFTSLRGGIKNLIYFLSGLSAFFPVFSIFLLYLPFSVFGLLLPKRDFIRNYVLGFAISFIPSMLIYLISTYLSMPLNFPFIMFLYFILPVAACIILKNKSLEGFELDSKCGLILSIVLASTTIVAIGIVDNESLFISNGIREFSRMQYAVNGLSSTGYIPIYNPGIGQGEATFLWDSPARAAQFIAEKFILKFIPSVLFSNTHSFFILFLHVLALSIIFDSILGQKKDVLNSLAVSAVAVLIGLNFYFLQKLESIKFFTAFPIAYLLISLIIDNPKKFNEILIALFIYSILLPVHSGYGMGVIILALSIFIIRKIYYLKKREELCQAKAWVLNNKLALAFVLIVIILVPIFYLSGGVIYKKFLRNQTSFIDTIKLGDFKKSIVGFYTDFYWNDLQVISLRFPDVQRIDDHVIGPIVSIFGIISFAALIFLYKSRGAENFGVYMLGYILYLIISSLISFYSINFSLLRTNTPYLIVLFGVSIIAFLGMFSNKIAKSALVAAVFIGFAYSAPYAMQNINNVHKEMFMSGNVYAEELNFMRQLPIDGRIMTYGVFNNAIDFGSNQLTGRYFSREEREELIYHIRNIYYKVHGPNSFGQEEYVLNKSKEYISNLLRLGGYKYVFANICHPMGNFFLNKIYPDYSYPIYQNQCLAFLVMNSTNYAEKIDLVENVDDETYNRKDGYRFTSISGNYNYGLSNFKFSRNPKEPEPLQFERLSATKLKIYGDFNDDEWVLFKERYWPRWKAYMNDKEVQIFPDEHEQILIKTSKGSAIILEYAVQFIEKIFGWLSIIGFLGFSAIILYLSKKQ